MTKKITRHQIESLIKSRVDVAVDLPSIWHNENIYSKSLRLSKSGIMLLKNIFKMYPIPLKPGFQVKNVHIKYIEQDIDYPYYLDSKKLVLFHDKSVLEIKLHDGDLDSWARTRWIEDRYNEPPVLPEESV
jgi:hypothetical protein